MELETLYLRLYDLTKQVEAIDTRLAVMEHFIKQRYPQYFAGEVGTVADPELKPIEIVYGSGPENGELNA